VVKRLLLIGLALGGALLLYGAYRDFTRVETGEDVARVPWLPDAARRVSFYRSYSFTAYEFDIAEQQFLTWAKDQGWEVQRIEREPRSVLRYHLAAGKVGAPADPPADATAQQMTSWQDAMQTYRSAISKTIERGYFYDRRQSNGGGVTVGYDVDTARAYVQTSPR
jgi:hypothetical protein